MTFKRGRLSFPVYISKLGGGSGSLFLCLQPMQRYCASHSSGFR
ncbi:hypothetical protein C4K40_3005 [Pseudomonas sp. CMR5c]|nr:hypothetical protein C4K40_3005 [Pseudomonas sp. CMR5c]